jgi:hypothetical protein
MLDAGFWKMFGSRRMAHGARRKDESKAHRAWRIAINRLLQGALLESGYWMLDARCLILDTGFWFLYDFSLSLIADS